MTWKKISQRENYSVSDCGEIRNDKTGRILKQQTHTCGYKTVMLGRKTQPLYVHRLVATAFIPNDDVTKQVDHINGDKTNNHVDNLRWLSPSENCYAYGYQERIENRKKKIVAINGDEVLHFNSRDETAAYFNCHKSQIKYGYCYKRGNKKGWTFYLDKDIV